MSWNIHTKILLMNKSIKQCAIIRKEDEKILTQSNNFNFFSKKEESEGFSSKQISSILKLFSSGGKDVSQNGFFICKKKFILLNFLKDEQTAFFKCENGGACLSQSNNFLIIGIWEDNSNEFIYKNGFFCNNGVINLKNLIVQAHN